MRMRERSSVERMRMALTEKRDMLGDIVAVEKGMQREREEKEKEKEKEKEGWGGEGRREGGGGGPKGGGGGGISSDGWLVLWCSLKTTKFEALVSRTQPRISAR